MGEEQTFMMSAQEQADRYITHIDEALASGDPLEMRHHIQEAMPYGQMIIDNLEDALNETEDPDVVDRIEEAMDHLSISMEQGDQALEMLEDEMPDLLMEMRRHAEQSTSFLGRAIGMAA